MFSQNVKKNVSIYTPYHSPSHLPLMSQQQIVAAFQRL